MEADKNKPKRAPSANAQPEKPLTRPHLVEVSSPVERPAIERAPTTALEMEQAKEAELHRLQSEARLQRERRCTAEIHAALEKYNCQLLPKLEFEGTSVRAAVKILAR